MDKIVELEKIIAEYKSLSQKATKTPWFHNKYDTDEHECGYMEIGPHELNLTESECNAYYEECIATFYGDEHNCEANAQLAVMAVNMVPLLINRIIELESKTSTELSKDVIVALNALNKWINHTQ